MAGLGHKERYVPGNYDNLMHSVCQTERNTEGRGRGHARSYTFFDTARDLKNLGKDIPTRFGYRWYGSLKNSIKAFSSDFAVG